ncbi:MAG: hypothetical protein RMI43_05035 [Candidatus Caldarchaeum sp.]|nr:hypothetical protein [Candidatus Caldarchaeum sp.]MCX8200663.1 hypothetical protein [Candidatus Caldarchaeum sp.]MDW8063515.1 hypothetical protein [Candidatus Caldarchaeum sp.]MDW8435648.1 hypothetical protein [Candidatus Caldarchaeum sp.]
MRKKEQGPRVIFLEVEVAGDGFDATVKAVRTAGYLSKVFRGREKNLLKSFLKALDEVDLLVTWGGGEKDLPILTAKAFRLGLDPSPLYEVFHLDLKQFFEKIFATQDTDVEKASEIIGVKKRVGKAEATAAVFERLKPVLRTVRPELAL